MDNKELDSILDTLKSNPKSTQIEDIMRRHFNELVDRDEFYQFSVDQIIDWSKKIDKISPEIARIFLRRMFSLIPNEISKILVYLDIEPCNADSASYVLSSLDFPLCKVIHDISPAFDFQHEKEKYMIEINNLKNLVQKKEDSCQSMIKDIQEWEKRYNSLKDESQKKEKKIKDYSKEQDEIKTLNSKLKNDIKKKRNKIDEFEKEKNQLSTVVNQHKSQIINLEKKLNECSIVNKPDKYESDIFKACDNGNLTSVRYIYQETASQIHSLTFWGKHSTLYHAVKNRNFEIAHFLNKKGVKWQIADSEKTSEFDQNQLNFLQNELIFVHKEFENGKLFNGIFYIISNHYKKNLIEQGLIGITSSSDEGGLVGNVLKNDDSRWWSKDIKNSWIQFDFKTRSISILSYSFQSKRGPKSWKIEGSNDKNDYTLIDKKNNPYDFKNNILVNQHYHAKGSKDPFRYIRITQGNDGRIDNTHYFYLNQVEFYGSLSHLQ